MYSPQPGVQSAVLTARATACSPTPSPTRPVSTRASTPSAFAAAAVSEPSRVVAGTNDGGTGARRGWNGERDESLLFVAVPCASSPSPWLNRCPVNSASSSAAASSGLRLGRVPIAMTRSIGPAPPCRSIRTAIPTSTALPKSTSHSLAGGTFNASGVGANASPGCGIGDNDRSRGTTLPTVFDTCSPCTASTTNRSGNERTVMVRGPAVSGSANCGTPAPRSPRLVGVHTCATHSARATPTAFTNCGHAVSGTGSLQTLVQ